MSLTDSADPAITFGRFLAVLKAIGISGEGEAELDFFARLYKVRAAAAKVVRTPQTMWQWGNG